MTTRNTKAIFLVMLCPLLFVMRPRLPIEGGQFATYPAIACVFAAVSLILLLKYGMHPSIVAPMTFLVLLFLIMCLSIFVNTTGVYAVTHLAKLVLFATVLMLGHFVGRLKTKDQIVAGLLKTAYVVLIVQTVVSATQLFDVSVFGWLYSEEKARPLGSLVRIVGTLGNPSIMAWIVTQMAVIVFLFEPKKSKKIMWLGICLALVFLSGSRSALLLYPAVIGVTYFLSKKKTTGFLLVKLPLFFLGLFVAALLTFWFLSANKEMFPYMYQLFYIFETGSLDSVNSFSERIVMWKDARYLLDSEGGAWTWLFGLGPGAIEVLDNDYFYSYINYGSLYVATQLLMYVVFVRNFLKVQDRSIMALGVQYILFSLIIGFQAETVSGWNYPVLIMFYAGLVVGMRSKMNNRKSQETKQLKAS